MFSWTRRFNPYLRIRGLIAMNKRLNGDCQDLADRLDVNARANSCLCMKLYDATEELKKLKLHHHNIVGRASLDAAAIPFYAKRIKELELCLEDCLDTMDPNRHTNLFDRALTIIRSAQKESD